MMLYVRKMGLVFLSAISLLLIISINPRSSLAVDTPPNEIPADPKSCSVSLHTNPFNALKKLQDDRQLKAITETKEKSALMAKQIIEAISSNDYSKIQNIYHSFTVQFGMNSADLAKVFNNNQSLANQAIADMGTLGEDAKSLIDQTKAFRNQMNTLLPEIKTGHDKAIDGIANFISHVPFIGSWAKTKITNTRDAAMTANDLTDTMEKAYTAFTARADKILGVIPVIIEETEEKKYALGIANAAVKNAIQEFEAFLKENEKSLSADVIEDYNNKLNVLRLQLEIGVTTYAQNAMQINSLKKIYFETQQGALQMGARGPLAVEETRNNIRLAQAGKNIVDMNKAVMAYLDISEATRTNLLLILTQVNQSKSALGVRVQEAAAQLGIHSQQLIALATENINNSGQSVKASNEVIAIMQKVGEELDRSGSLLDGANDAMNLIKPGN